MEFHNNNLFLKNYYLLKTRPSCCVKLEAKNTSTNLGYHFHWHWNDWIIRCELPEYITSQWQDIINQYFNEMSIILFLLPVFVCVLLQTNILCTFKCRNFNSLEWFKFKAIWCHTQIFLTAEMFCFGLPLFPFFPLTENFKTLSPLSLTLLFKFI